MLGNLQGSTAGTSLSKSQDDIENITGASSGCRPTEVSENAHIAKLKSKKSSATTGTVSHVIGKDYITPRSQSNGSNEKFKPVKLHSNDFPVSVIWDEKKDLASASCGESMDDDVQEFLFKMLGNGFQLEMSVIQDVIGQCGYNMPKSIDKLLDLSAATLEKNDDVIGIAAGNVRPAAGRLETGVSSEDESILSRTETNKSNIQREVLEALFTEPVKQESTNPVRPVRQSPYGRVVSKPLEDTMIEDFTFITRLPVNDSTDEANQNSYEELRKAVMEYWATMKEYYKAALDAFTKKDYENAQLLLEEGNFFMRKAREADEQSAQKLIEDSDTGEEYSINLHYLEPKDALQNMQLQLTSLSGLPTIHYLKVVLGTSGSNKDVRRKRRITELLEQEGIPWAEEGNGWTISIRMDEINPRKLSFANK